MELKKSVLEQAKQHVQEWYESLSGDPVPAVLNDAIAALTPKQVAELSPADKYYHGGKSMAQSGCFIIPTDDMRKQLKEWYPEEVAVIGKMSGERVLDVYSAVCGVAVRKLAEANGRC